MNPLFTAIASVMRSALGLLLLLLAGLAAHAGCDDFSKEDIRLLEKYGGLYSPSGEGPTARMAPVDAVMLDSPKRALSDAEFAVAFPIIQRMNPYRLHIRGEHTIGDESVDLLNQLTALRVLDTSGTRMTLEGLKTLNVSSLKQLSISPEKFSEAQASELQKALPGVEVARWRTDGPRNVGSEIAPTTNSATTRAS